MQSQRSRKIQSELCENISLPEKYYPLLPETSKQTQRASPLPDVEPQEIEIPLAQHIPATQVLCLALMCTAISGSSLGRDCTLPLGNWQHRDAGGILIGS